MKRGKTRTSTTFGRRFYPNPIEREAEACIARCMKAQAIAALPLPVPVDQWIEGALKIRFGIEDLSHLGADVLGAAYIKEREILVSEKLLSNEGRFRFTCSHELGHFVLHGKLLKAFRDTTAEPGQGRDLHEREADRFAAALLMPAAVAVQTIIEVCREGQLDPMATRQDILADPADASRQQSQVMALSTRFAVSRSAASFRLLELLRPEVGPFMTAVRPPLFLAGQ